jgi:predicted nuclease of predicted toxin-antitoxin system
VSIAILVDMNLSPEWVPLLERHGSTAKHWSMVGDPRAPDKTIMAWASTNNHVVFTHDLDFGTTLALSHATVPSVIQVRGQNVLPDHMGPLVIAAIRQHEADLAAGALIVVDEKRRRVRILPF